MVATAAAIISMARSMKAVKTAHAACGSSANAPRHDIGHQQMSEAERCREDDCRNAE
ncbi:hypothetical protein ACVWXQ_004588 [Bradyrhizobium sp. S3.14.4]